MSQTSWKPLITTNNSKITPLEMKEDSIENILFMGINTDIFLSQPSKSDNELQQFSVETTSSVIGMAYIAKSNSGAIEIKNNVPIYRHSKSTGGFYYSFFPVNMTDIETSATSTYENDFMNTSSLEELLQNFEDIYNKVNIAANIKLKGINDFKDNELIVASEKFVRQRQIK